MAYVLAHNPPRDHDTISDLIKFPITALREIKLLKLLAHKNILKLEDMAIEHPTRQSTCPHSSSLCPY